MFFSTSINAQWLNVDNGGFDTHANQINSQSKLLSQFDSALNAFIQELKLGNSFDNTVIMVFQNLAEE